MGYNPFQVFVHLEKPNHVSKLVKTVYELNQAPRVWYEKLKRPLLAKGFVNAISDTSGFCVYFGENIVQWCSRKQKTVALSSTEFKYRALSQVSTGIAWIRSLLGEIQIP